MENNIVPKMTSPQAVVEDCRLIEVFKIQDPRGNIGVVEKDIVPFVTKRVYYLYDIPSSASRGGHAHKELFQFLIALSGSFDVLIQDGCSKKKITLNKPDVGLLIKPGIWRELENFSSGAVCLVLASDVYIEEDYIRSFDDFLSFKAR